jgi:HAD superfamily hydrolase (TIGR01509 family)
VDNSRRSNPLQAIFFDLDGTLVDTEKAASIALEQSLALWGIQATREDAAEIAGRTWEAALRSLRTKYRFPLSEEETLKHVLGNYRETLQQELPLVPGGVEAVRALATQYPLALVSGSHRREILWCLERLQIQKEFSIILGAEDYPASKPAPDGYLRAMQELKIPQGAALVFEDSEPGIRSARAAGQWVVAITSTNHFGHSQSQAHHRIPNLVGVNPAWVQNLAPSLVP